MKADLLIKGGVIVTALDIFPADIAVKDEIIISINDTEKDVTLRTNPGCFINTI